MLYSKKIPAFIIALFVFITGYSQKPQFSLATDISLLRSFKMGQRYWAIGQTVNFNFHITPKDGAYAWISYYSPGKFNNDLLATAKSPAILPQQVNYTNSAQLKFKHISIGWKRYLKGAPDIEKKWSIYSYAGFGLMLGAVENIHLVPVDTSIYVVPVRAGKANFKRLTFDLGLGVEFPIGGDIFLYFEGRALVPTTDYPSPYLFVNENAPFCGAANAGVRILFH
ncbi:MAG: hypothetical protein Q8941_09675 [Bacteroidota bacterium]|nr:hypothetical protein [Bacteroidota bacterium]